MSATASIRRYVPGTGAARLGLAAMLGALFCPTSLLQAQSAGDPDLYCDTGSRGPEAAAVATSPIPLSPDRVLTTPLAAGQTVIYSVGLPAGGTYLLELSQDQLDYVVTIDGPKGGPLSFDSPMRRVESELVVLDDVGPGEYRISVSSDEYTGTTASHSIRLSRITPADDAVKLPVLRLISRGSRYHRLDGPDNHRLARDAYLEASELARAAGLDALLAHALFAVAHMDYSYFNAATEASATAERVAELYRDLGEPWLAASAIHFQAAALIESTNSRETMAEAIELFRQAAEMQRQLGRPYELAHSLNNLGLTYYLMGDWENARRHWQDAAPMFAAQNEYEGELLALGNLGVVDAEQGRLGDAVIRFEQVLELLPRGARPRYRVDTWSNLAWAHRILNDFDAALQGFSCARQIAERENYDWGFGWALAGSGTTYFAMGDVSLAEQFLTAALPIEQRVEDVRGVATVQRNLGDINRLNGDYLAALEHHGLALEATASATDRILAQLDVARDLSALGRHDAAIALMEDAFRSAGETASRLLVADTQRVMGMVLQAGGRHEEALAHLDAASEAYASLRMLAERAQTLNAMADTSRSMGDLPASIRYGEAAIALIEQVRGRVADPSLRAAYLSARRDYFNLQIERLVAAQSPEEPSANRYLVDALETSERSRARLTLDLLQRGVIESGALPAEARERQGELYRSLAEYRYRIDLVDRAAADDASGEQPAAMLPALAGIENELNVLETRSRATQGTDAELLPATLDLNQMQAAIDPDSVLLQYSLNSETSYVWAVTADHVAGAALPPAATIEALARQVFDDISRQNPGSRSEAQARVRQLSELVLDPVRAHLTKRRLIIAADGALQYIPFSALQLTSDDGSSEMLLERFEIVGISSLSAIEAQRQRRRRTAPAKTIAVFADPVIGATDSRLANLPTPPPGPIADPSGRPTPASSRTETPLERLPWTAREASAIEALVPAAKRSIAVSFDATVDGVRSADLHDYRILHFATHGLIDTSYPDLSALVLSEFDATGRRRDAYLDLHDIYELDLNADLVVLSACQTALGQDIRAEGLLGLTQGFLYAGSRSVVATLWPIADRASAELMSAFYEELFAAVPPAEALRRAQLRIAAQSRWNHPYFWAGYTLIGDWRQAI